MELLPRSFNHQFLLHRICGKFWCDTKRCIGLKYWEVVHCLILNAGFLSQGLSLSVKFKLVVNVMSHQHGAQLRCRILSNQPLRDKKNPILTAHTGVQGELKRNLVLQNSKKRSSGQSAVSSPVSTGWKCQDLHGSLCSQIVKLVTCAGHLPRTSDPVLKVTSVAESWCKMNTNLTSPLPCPFCFWIYRAIQADFILFCLGKSDSIACALF